MHGGGATFGAVASSKSGAFDAVFLVDDDAVRAARGAFVIDDGVVFQSACGGVRNVCDRDAAAAAAATAAAAAATAATAASV